MTVEVEARFRATSLAPLDRLTSRPTLGPAVLGAPHVVFETDRYLDTADGRLAAARWACRLRSRDGVMRLSLKGPPETPATGWLHRRPEVEGPATSKLDPRRWPPSAATDLLADLAGNSELVVQLVLEQRRVERAVVTDARAVGTLTLDTVAATRADRRAEPFHLVELELAGGTARDLADLAGALAADRDLAAEPRTKLEIALSLLDADAAR